MLKWDTLCKYFIMHTLEKFIKLVLILIWNLCGKYYMASKLLYMHHENDFIHVDYACMLSRGVWYLGILVLANFFWLKIGIHHMICVLNVFFSMMPRICCLYRSLGIGPLLCFEFFHILNLGFVDYIWASDLDPSLCFGFDYP